MQPPDPASASIAQRRSLRRRTVIALVATSLMFAAGCNRLTLMRPDTSRGDFESTAHEVIITNKGKSSAGLARVQMAQQSLAKGDFVAAEREAKQALKVDSKSAGAYTVLAIVQDHSGNAAAAGQHYRRAADLAPTDGGMLNNYGTWLCRHGRGAESLAWFEQALAAPGYQTPAVAAGNAGACALQAGQTARAEQLLRQTLAIDPENQVALSAMTELEFKAGRTMTARAFSQRRLAAAPADRPALLLASQIEQKLGDRAAAEAYVRRLRAEFPDTHGSESADDGRK